MLISKSRTTVVVHTTWDDVSDTTSGCHGSRTQRCKAVPRGSPDPECRDDPWRHRRGRGCRGGSRRRLGGSQYDSRRRRHRGGIQDGSHRGFGHARRDDHNHPDDAKGHHDIKDPANHGGQPCIAASWIRGTPTWYRTRRPTWCGQLPSSYLPRSTFCQSNPRELASLRP